MDGIGIITQEDALAYGITGPMAALGRASPTTSARTTRTWSTTGSTSTSRSASVGDNFDRYLVRVEEMQQSMRILEQALEQIPPGPVHHRRPAHRAAAQARDLQHDRGDDPPLQAHHGRHPRAARRGLLATPRAATASSASTSSPTAPAGPGSAACARPASPTPPILHKLLIGLFIADIVPDLRHDQHDRRGVRPLMPDTDPAPLPAAAPARRRRAAAETVTVTIDGQRVTSSRRAPTCSRPARRLGIDIRFFCYHPGLSLAAVLPAVPGRRQGAAQAGAVLLHAGRRQDGGRPPTRRACWTSRAADARVHAAQPPDRLPDLRQGGRVHAAEALLRLGRQVRRATTASRSRRPRSSTSARTSCSTRSAASCAPAASASATRSPSSTSSRWPTAATTRC